jgi:hypothetical protein
LNLDECPQWAWLLSTALCIGILAWSIRTVSKGFLAFIEASRKAHIRTAEDVKRIDSALGQLRSDLDELAADVREHEDRSPRSDGATRESAQGAS